MKSKSDIQGYVAERSGGKVSARYLQVRLAGRIAAGLDAIRQEQGLSQDALAKLAGTSKPQVNRLLSGDYTGMTTKSLCKIAAALGCDVEVKFPPVRHAESRPRRHTRAAASPRGRRATAAA